MMELLFTFIGVLLSPPGIVMLGGGLVAFLGLPMIPKITGRFHGINRLYLYLATASVSRAAVVISEHNDAYFKPMKFDARGVEKITLDGQTKDFEDPDGALHTWLGVPFALADEVHGVLFDPRHAALGQRKHDLRERGDDEYYATNREWNEWDVSKWVPGVFEMPAKHEIVDLSKVREIIDGGERAEYPRRVEALYQNSREPFMSSMAAMKFLMPAIAFVVTFGGIWLVVTKLGGGSGGPDTTVEYGASIALLLIGLDNIRDLVSKLRKKIYGSDTQAEDQEEVVVNEAENVEFEDLELETGDESDEEFTDAGLESDSDGVDGGSPDDDDGRREIDWQRLAILFAGTVLCALPVIAFIASSLVLGVSVTMILVVIFVLGFISVPTAARLSKPIYPLATAFSRLFFTLGFLGYRKPVFEWTPRRYRVVEYDELETTDDVCWYGLFNSIVGFTYTPGEQSWGAEWMDQDEIENRKPVTDGGEDDSNIPSRWVPAPSLQRDTYGALVPRRLKRSKHYLHSGIALARFKNSATGGKSLSRLLEAKEQGENSLGISDKVLLYATCAGAFLGVVLGALIFLL